MQLPTAEEQRGELQQFVNSLRDLSDSEVGTVLAMAAVMRLSLRKHGLASNELLHVTPEIDQAKARLAVAEFVRSCQEAKRYNEATGAMVWLHSLRARSTPGLRNLGREMWGELQRGRRSAPDILFRLLDVPLPDVIEGYWRIPDDLDPARHA